MSAKKKQAKQAVPIEDVAGKQVGLACQIIEELMIELFGTSYPDSGKNELADELFDVKEKLSELQDSICTLSFEFPPHPKYKSALVTRDLIDLLSAPQKSTKKSKAARAGGK